ncbi:hypothetical protein CIPAW_01G209300 [Carya illinoinensis]|uniref:Uncharacterized protein n=1 Tax=Carya illinoinensis TaxID=32201 RepID=A0A8T1RP63_CARIL|nr:hypothetical protein CIPAW_01G209300 [Carya illinoinensis]
MKFRAEQKSINKSLWGNDCLHKGKGEMTKLGAKELSAHRLGTQMQRKWEKKRWGTSLAKWKSKVVPFRSKRTEFQNHTLGRSLKVESERGICCFCLLFLPLKILKCKINMIVGLKEIK